MMTTRSPRLAAGVVAAGVLLVPLAACSSEAQDDASSALTSAAESAGSAAESAGSAAGSATASAGAAASSAATEVSDRVDCSGSSCAVTLGTGSNVDVLGTELSLDSVADGEATVSIGDRTESCTEGETVSAGPISIECTEISDESITLTASLG